MSTFNSRTEKSLARVFEEFAEPIKIILTKNNVTSGSIITKEDLILKINSEYIKGFFVKPTTKNGETVINEFDGELLVRDIKFNLNSSAFSVGSFTFIEALDTLTINSVDIPIALEDTVDTLITKISQIQNIFCFKLSSTDFAIISSLADTEDEIDYKDLTITGTLQTKFGFEILSKKALPSIKINNVLYSILKTFNGSFLKCLYLKRG